MPKTTIVEALTSVLNENHLTVTAPNADGHHEVVHVKGELARFLKKGDKVKSSDLDDYQNEGFKVKEQK